MRNDFYLYVPYLCILSNPEPCLGSRQIVHLWLLWFHVQWQFSQKGMAHFVKSPNTSALLTRWQMMLRIFQHQPRRNDFFNSPSEKGFFLVLGSKGPLNLRIILITWNLFPRVSGKRKTTTAETSSTTARTKYNRVYILVTWGHRSQPTNIETSTHWHDRFRGGLWCIFEKYRQSCETHLLVRC